MSNSGGLDDTFFRFGVSVIVVGRDTVIVSSARGLKILRLPFGGEGGSAWLSGEFTGVFELVDVSFDVGVEKIEVAVAAAGEVGVSAFVAATSGDCEMLRVFVFDVDCEGGVLSGRGRSSTTISMPMFRARLSLTSCG